jgi:hypothetical protein
MRVYICKIKLIGFPFATASKERAERWVEESESHYFEELEIEDL